MDLGQMKERISPEMQRVERIIQATLSADSEAIQKLVEHVSLYSGKRLRPALVIIVSKALERTTEDHYKLGAVIELIHTATLLHDDILDEATMRRRVASVNHLYGNHVPVLLGDLIYARAFALSLTLSTADAARILSDVTQTICSGEIEQIFCRGRFDLTEDHYYSIIHAKTASLYRASCGLAVFYSKGTHEAQAALERYGMALGMAFQIVDDCLDIIGEEDVVGKSLGTDTRGGKMTLPLIHLSASLSERDRMRLKDIFLSDALENKNEAIASEFDLQASIHHAYSVADSYISKALNELAILPSSPFKGALETVTDFVLHRKQ